ncbi:unnamed protein product [Rhizoctonia solani]|uniref:Uncharacterized protein n=1 Tax=Rhizoctonia solani TaxID=456999 RepID=A0A8H3DF67_9AGAM|nr:unnamed protein product [Rhizoctonia solani]
MRGRGRGGHNQARGGRGSGNNRDTPRTSTRNWERAPAGPVPATSGSKASSIGNRGIKDDDRAGLQWLPSVSRSSGLEPNGDARSSGLEPNGDALRSFETQREYWEFITEKILNLEIPGRYIPKSPSERQEKESNTMILLRMYPNFLTTPAPHPLTTPGKLREGFVATDRRDSFAIQVVEKSTYLSILYNSPINIASSFAYLLDVYAVKPEIAKTPNLNKTVIGLLQFLQSLVDEFPSQRVSHRLIVGSDERCLPHNSAEWWFASDLSSALRRNNWWALEKLTSPKAVDERLKKAPWATPTSGPIEPDLETEAVFSKLPSRALAHLLEQLRTKVRNSAWPVLRSAYREVVKAPWLERSLLLPNEGIVEFMRVAVEKSEAVAKDTATDVWILRRPAVRV